MNICEEYICLQGEGKYIGTPSYMIRTTGCNLRCAWKNHNNSITICDTPFSSYNAEKGYLFNSAQALRKLKYKHNKIKHIIITGGEPTLQNDLVEKINLFAREGYTVTVETNGTIPIVGLENKDKVLISISPKMKNSYNQKDKIHKKIHNVNNRTLRETLKETIQEVGDYQLKFVVSNKNDLREINKLVKELHAPYSKVWLMPQGITRKQISKVEKWLVDECIKNGYKLTTRMHINIYGKRRGV